MVTHATILSIVASVLCDLGDWEAPVSCRNWGKINYYARCNMKLGTRRSSIFVSLESPDESDAIEFLSSYPTPIAIITQDHLRDLDQTGHIWRWCSRSLRGAFRRICSRWLHFMARAIIVLDSCPFPQVSLYAFLSDSSQTFLYGVHDLEIEKRNPLIRSDIYIENKW